MALLPLALASMLAAIPPLTAGERGRLATAFDGRDHQEEAFAALVEHARRWTPGPGDAPLRLHADPAALCADPEAYRGDLCRVEGVLQQATALDGPWRGVTEWFVRDAAGRPLLVYVVDAGAGFREGTAVRIDARFYKRVEAEARDGRRHEYPAFVGAHPLPPAAHGGGALPLLAALLAVLGGVFLALLLLVRRQRHRPRTHARRTVIDATAVDDGAGLPDDPADALAEMKRRVESDP